MASVLVGSVITCAAAAGSASGTGLSMVVVVVAASASGSATGFSTVVVVAASAATVAGAGRALLVVDGGRRAFPISCYSMLNLVIEMVSSKFLY